LVHESWLEKPKVKRWLDENPSVRKFMSNFENPRTKLDYAYLIWQFCKWAQETPEALVSIRVSRARKRIKDFREKHGIPNTSAIKDVDGNYAVVDLLQKILRGGELPDQRGYAKTDGKRRIIRIASLSANKREQYLTAVRSYFKSLRAPITWDTSFKITQTNRVPRQEFDKSGTKGVDEVRAIAYACKEPYKTLFLCAAYAGLGAGETELLNKLWVPQILPQLKSGKTVVKIDYGRRKSNNQPYYSFLPAKLLTPWLNRNEGDQKPPFINTQLKPVQYHNLSQNWWYARKRANIGKSVTIHNMRDLWRTSAVKAGVNRRSQSS